MKKLRFFFGFLLWIAGSISYAGNLPDSVENALYRYNKASDKAEYLLKAAKSIGYQDPAYTTHLAFHAHELIRMNDLDDSLLLESIYLLSSNNINQALYYKALKDCEEGIPIAEKAGSLRMLALLYNDRGISYDFLGRWPEATEAYLSALKYYTLIKDNRGISYALVNLGIVKYNLKDYAQAESYMLKALHLADSLKLPDPIITAKSNLAMVYEKTGRPEKALFYYHEVLKADLQTTPINNAWVGSDYNNLAMVLVSMKKYLEARKYAYLGLEYKKKEPNPRNLASSYLLLAEIHHYLKNAKEEKSFLDSASRFAEKAQDPTLIADIYSLRIKLLRNAGNYREALLLSEELNILKDSLYNLSILESTDRLSLDYEAELQDIKVHALERELQTRNLSLIYLICGAIGLVVLSVWLLIYRLRDSRQKKILREQKEKLDQTLEQLRTSLTELNESKTALEHALLIKTRFLSMVSHEIRTPMNVLVNLSQLLMEENKASTEKLDMMHKASEHLLELVNNILDQSKLEEGKMTLQPEVFDWHKQLVNTTDIFRSAALEKDLDLQLVSEVSEPLMIRADKGKLSQILVNLLGNAIKFTDEGQVSLSYRILPSRTGKVKLYVEVRDTGIGIPKEETAHIFEPFVQGVTSKKGGTGLGLSISNSLLNLMGSRLELQSEMNQGSRFYFTIECDLAEEAKIKTEISSEEGQKRAIKILAAEDDPVNQHILELVLSSLGQKVDFAASGKEALEKCLSENYELIFMDLHMPEMTGIEATRRIRQLESFHQTPIYIISAASREEIDQLPQNLFSGYISKPYRKEQLADVLKNIILQSE